MKIKKIILLSVFCFFLQGTVFASIGFDLNQTLQQFFGSGQAPISSQKYAPSRIKFMQEFSDFENFESGQQTDNSKEIQNFNIPEVFVPENPTQQDLNDFKQEIISEEESLEQFNQKLAQEEKKLWIIQENKNSLQTQVMLLDRQIDFNTQKLKKYNQEVKKWRNKIEQITQSQSLLRVVIQTKANAYQKAQQKNHFQKKRLNINQSASLFNWIFSDLTTSQILEQKKYRQVQLQKQKQELNQLKQIQKQKSLEEKKIALLYGQLQKNQQQVAQEKMRLLSFTEGKSQLLKRLKSSSVEQKEYLKNSHKQKNETALYLQELRHGLKKTTENLNNNFDQETGVTQAVKIKNNDSKSAVSSGIFDFPLKLPMFVTANFRDPKYYERFKKKHDGVDFYAPQGTEIYAPADGVVKKLKTGTYDYAYIILQHDKDLYTIYGHLSEVLVQKGDLVKKGQLIGKTGGAPGTKGAGYFTTGPHLHWEVFEDHQYQDPLNYLAKK